MDEDKPEGGESETDQKKKGLLAAGGGLVAGVESGDADSEDYIQDAEDEQCELNEEAKIKKKDTKILANFFCPVHRQISEIISDVSPPRPYIRGASTSILPPNMLDLY